MKTPFVASEFLRRPLIGSAAMLPGVLGKMPRHFMLTALRNGRTDSNSVASRNPVTEGDVFPAFSLDGY